MEYKSENELILDELLREEYARLRYAAYSGSIGQYTQLYHLWKRTQNIIRYFLEELSRVNGTLRIADIGCGNGLYIWLLRDILGTRDAEFCGIDLSSARIHLARRMQARFNAQNISFLTGDAAEIKLPDAWADIVLCSETIEHIAEPGECLEEIRRILKPDGAAIITTPNKNNPARAMRRLLDPFYKHPREEAFKPEEKEAAMFDRHVSVRDFREWAGVFKQSGFIIENVRRGSLFYGNSRHDRFPLFFSFSLILDAVLDWIPLAAAITENLAFKLRKP